MAKVVEKETGEDLPEEGGRGGGKMDGRMKRGKAGWSDGAMEGRRERGRGRERERGRKSIGKNINPRDKTMNTNRHQVGD